MKYPVLASILAVALVTPATAAPDAAQKAQARDIYETIIGFETSVEGRENPQMAEYLAGIFAEGGFAGDAIHVLPLEDTAALVVTYEGDGTGGAPILLLAHMDVVTAHREDWDRDPFTLIEEDGMFYGRGTIDNKGGVALLTATFLDLKAQGFVPSRDLVIVFTGDEETSGATSRYLLTEHRDLVDAEYALNSDSGGGTFEEETGAPIAYSLQTAEKSFASYELTATNAGGHSSRPRADNAIYDLMDALAGVRGQTFPVRWNDTTIASLKAEGEQTEGPLGEAMLAFAANPGEGEAADILAASPNHIGQIRTTCVPTLLDAGHADNALPQRAVATVNCRIFPGITIEEIQVKLQELAGEKVAVTLRDEQYWSSDASPLRPDVVAAVESALEAVYPGVPLTPSMSAGATDGVFFRAEGIPTYGVSSLFIKGSDEYAHGLNERLPVASFYNGLTYWQVLLKELAGPE